MAWTVSSSFVTTYPYVAPTHSFLISTTADSNTRFLLELLNLHETYTPVVNLHNNQSETFTLTNTTVLHKFLSNYNGDSISFIGDGHHSALAFAISYLTVLGDTTPLPLSPVHETLSIINTLIGTYNVRPNQALVLTQSILAARASYNEASSSLLFTDRSYKLFYDIATSNLNALDTPDPRFIDALVSALIMTGTAMGTPKIGISNTFFLINSIFTSINTNASLTNNFNLLSNSANTFNGLCNTTLDYNTSTLESVRSILTNFLVLSSTPQTAFKTTLSNNLNFINNVAIKAIRVIENGEVVLFLSNSANTQNAVMLDTLPLSEIMTSQAVSNYSDLLAFSSAQELSLYLTKSTGFTLTSGTKVTFIPSSIQEAVSFIVESANSRVEYLYDILSISSLVDTNRYGAISEILSLSTLVSLSQGYSVLEELNITKLLQVVLLASESVEDLIDLADPISSAANIHALITSIIKLQDAVRSTDVSVVSELLDLSITKEALIKAYSDLIDSLIHSENYLSSSVFKGVILNTFHIDSNLSLLALYNQIISEEILLTLPDVIRGGYSTYLLSPESKGVSTYTNFNFDGSCESNGKYLFYNSTGVYEYGGKYDAGDAIKARLVTSVNTFGTSNLKMLPEIYLGYSSESGIVLKVNVDDRGSFLYKLNKNTNNLQVNKIALGKGLSGKYFQFELISESGDLTIDKIRMNPLMIRRKI
jgi:hypothetical protein